MPRQRRGVQTCGADGLILSSAWPVFSSIKWAAASSPFLCNVMGAAEAGFVPCIKAEQHKPSICNSDTIKALGFPDLNALSAARSSPLAAAHTAPRAWTTTAACLWRSKSSACQPCRQYPQRLCKVEEQGTRAAAHHMHRFRHSICDAERFERLSA